MDALKMRVLDGDRANINKDDNERQVPCKGSKTSIIELQSRDDVIDIDKNKTRLKLPATEDMTMNIISSETTSTKDDEPTMIEKKKHNHTHSHMEQQKSYCITHKDQEIVFACYQCQKMCCSMCEDKHDGHTKAFFKDQFIYPNYENVEQVPQQIIQQEYAKSESGGYYSNSSSDASGNLSSNQLKSQHGKSHF